MLNLIQRIILFMGCNALILLWLQPPVYQIQADGTRLEQGLLYFWHIAPEWSVNTPLVFARILIIVLITVGLSLVFRTNPKQEGHK